VANHYPVFLNLNKVPCLVVGGGEVAFRKTESLLLCGAEVTVISPELCPSLQELQETKHVTWICKTYQTGDCQGFQMVISATDQEETNALVAKECKAARTLVNVVDDPPKCSFFVPSVLRRGKLVIAVSTGGASPITARLIREGLEQQYGPEYDTYLEVLAEARKVVLKNVPDAERRREIFEQLSNGSLLRLIEQGCMYEAKEWVKKCLS
jgi:precorrin-2 dehydrogenase / sirohydrochlorin ferrochelatase